MNGNGLNTLEYAEKLKNAGVPEAQAFIQAQMIYDIVASTLATKRDIKDLDLKIETVRADLKRDIKELDNKLEATKKELDNNFKRDMKILEGKIALKMALNSGAMVLTILSTLVALGKLGMLDPTPLRPALIEQVRPFSPQK